jgi:hypothetical protein
VLEEHYDEIEATFLTPDPQDVDQAWLERRSAVDPEALLQLDVWERLIQLRERDPSGDELAQLWKLIASLEPASR